MIAGLEEVSAGKIMIDGRDVTYVEPADRKVSMVFQSYALFPHMTVRDNMAFGLKMSKMPRAEIEPRVKEAAAILQIENLLDRKPRQLSGGQRQRVAIGRAIVRQPKLFLFDEPLSNLDAELRTQMRAEIARLHRHLGITTVYVTHDQVEAVTLADRIIVLHEGSIEQVGTPTELYDSPANIFVAGFIGSPKINFVPAVVTGAGDEAITISHPALTTGALTLSTRKAHQVKVGETVMLGIRPEHLALGDSGPSALAVRSDFVENLGGAWRIYAKTEQGNAMSIMAPGRHQLSKGDRLTLTIDPLDTYLFNAKGLAI